MPAVVSARDIIINLSLLFAAAGGVMWPKSSYFFIVFALDAARSRRNGASDKKCLRGERLAGAGKLRRREEVYAAGRA